MCPKNYIENVENIFKNIQTINEAICVPINDSSERTQFIIPQKATENDDALRGVSILIELLEKTAGGAEVNENSVKIRRNPAAGAKLKYEIVESFRSQMSRNNHYKTLYFNLKFKENTKCK